MRFRLQDHVRWGLYFLAADMVVSFYVIYSVYSHGKDPEAAWSLIVPMAMNFPGFVLAGILGVKNGDLVFTIGLLVGSVMWFGFGVIAYLLKSVFTPDHQKG